MLVKMLTEYGPKPTVVVWDAGSSGARRSTRTTRPSAARARPAQAAVAAPRAAGRGVRLPQRAGRRLRGRRRHRLDRRARARAGRARVIVTGDRDAFQLIDPEGRVQVMATARGITDTKLYDHQAVIDRYGIPPELIPDFYGLKGDTSDNIPGVPGIGDKTASDLLQRFGDLEDVLDQRRRDLRRQAQGEPHRARRRRAHLQAAGDDAARHRRSSSTSPGGRARARPLAPARGLPRVRAARPAARAWRRRSGGRGGGARAAAAEQTVGRKVRAGSLADVAKLPARRRGGARGARARDARGRAVRRGARWRFGVAGGRGRGRRRVRRARGARRSPPATGRSSPTTRSRCGAVPAEPGPRHAARRLPARAGAPRLPVPRALEERGLAATPRSRPRPTRRSPRRWRRGSASRSRERGLSG